MRMLVMALLAMLVSLSSCVSNDQPRYLLKVQKIAREVAADMDFKDPQPIVTLVSDTHWSLPGRGAQAAASLDSQGQGWIYIRRSHELNSAPFIRGLLYHEFAHLQTWRTYGVKVRMHGPEFSFVCRQYTSRKNCATTYID